MSAHVQQASILNGRSMTLMAVIGLHALVIAALIAIKYVPPMIEQKIDMQWVKDDPPEVVPPQPQPQPRPVELQRFQVVVPVIKPQDIQFPEEALVVEAGPAPAADTGPVQVDAGPGTGPVIAPPPPRVFTQLDYRAVKSPDEFYPPTSVSLQEQGVAIVQVCVGTNGKIDGQPTIQTSSGYKRLDQAAMRWTREALRFTPATENGVGIRACKGFRVVFDLN
jgi:TonB family protein